jgi:hypothetical protein
LGGKTTLLGGWHGHLLVTPSLHDAIQRDIELVRNLELRELFCLNNNKPEKSVKKILGILGISPRFINLCFYWDL